MICPFNNVPFLVPNLSLSRNNRALLDNPYYRSVYAAAHNEAAAYYADNYPNKTLPSRTQFGLSHKPLGIEDPTQVTSDFRPDLSLTTSALALGSTRPATSAPGIRMRSIYADTFRPPPNVRPQTATRPRALGNHETPTTIHGENRFTSLYRGDYVPPNDVIEEGVKAESSLPKTSDGMTKAMSTRARRWICPNPAPTLQGTTVAYPGVLPGYTGHLPSNRPDSTSHSIPGYSSRDSSSKDVLLERVRRGVVGYTGFNPSSVATLNPTE